MYTLIVCDYVSVYKYMYNVWVCMYVVCFLVSVMPGLLLCEAKMSLHMISVCV